jgi:hypothetical protein
MENKETAAAAAYQDEDPGAVVRELDAWLCRFDTKTDYVRGLRDGWLAAQGKAAKARINTQEARLRDCEQSKRALEAELENSKRDAKDWYDALAEEQRKMSRLQAIVRDEAHKHAVFAVASDEREALLATELAREKKARDEVAVSEETVRAELERERSEHDKTRALLREAQADAECSTVALLTKRLEVLEAKLRDAEQDAQADMEECEAVQGKLAEKLSELIDTVNLHTRMFSALASRRVGAYTRSF